MNELSPIEKIARILRTDKHHLIELEKRMAETTGKKGVFEKIYQENENLVRDRMQTLGLSKDSGAKEIYDALISKIESDDSLIFKTLGEPLCHKKEDCHKVASTALRITGNPKGFFLKTEKAREFLLNEPPLETMKFLGYDSAEKMLESEDLFEVYASLRFIEGSDWLNNVFFKQYENLTAADFEEREVRVMALDYKWAKTAEGFVVKKKHNISHLKELGVVFVIPIMLGISGEILRMFALVLHYLNEIPFYSDVARKISKEDGFAAKYISLLRGDVVENEIPVPGEKTLWLVVQRYLSKEDNNDWRLFVPHINPEAMHWEKAETNLSNLSENSNGFLKELSFWHGLNWVGDYFRDESGVEVLVSFNLVDTVMSLVKEKEMVKYLYHHQEALWNKIFEEYSGEGGLEKYSRDYLLKGYFEI
ncbi:MAG TPA: hypothetical protein VMV71_01250 [Candidatus Paceibacterota bacterium]|nr:hypothetical protein [Candidatus Paceibacterota bacterium]